MKASEVITLLQSKIDETGDRYVYVSSDYRGGLATKLTIQLVNSKVVPTGAYVLYGDE